MTSCNKNLTQLSDKQKSVLTGHLLGDGHLTKSKLKGNPCLSIGRKLDDHSYNEWTYNIFIEYCSENALKIEKCKASAFNINAKNTLDGIYTKSTLRTMHIPAFLPYQKLWYPNDKKIVPNDLILDPLMIAVWHADDGVAHIREKAKNGNDSLRVKFCTQGFTKDEVYYLKHLLDTRYNVKFNVSTQQVNYLRKNGETNYENYSIIGSDHAARPLYQDIDAYYMPCMSRKSDIWRNTKNFYTQIKSNGKSLIDHQLKIRIEVIETILNCDNYTTIQKIAKVNNAYFICANGKKRVSEVITNTVNSYIKKGWVIFDLLKGQGPYHAARTSQHPIALNSSAIPLLQAELRLYREKLNLI